MTKRRWAAVIVASAVALVGALLAMLVHRPSGHVAMPARDASAEEVVRAHVAALDAHDCSTAAALMTDAARDRAETWCDDVDSLTEVRVSSPIVEDPAYSGHRADEQVVYVPVSFDLSWRLFHDDGSMPEGSTTWGYLLTRAADDQPWRIFDEGIG